MKTLFNMLGPMVNPSSPGNQLVGVFSLDVARLYNYIYQESGIRFAIIHSLDGYDEISLTSPFKVFTNESESILRAEDLGFEPLTQDQIFGGDTVEQASKIFLDIMRGEGTDAQNSEVIANAGFALQIMDQKSELDSCMQKAAESLKSGRALQAFNKLIELS